MQTGRATLRNLGDTALTGITVAVDGASSGMQVTLDGPTTLLPNATAVLSYSFVAANSDAGTSRTVTLRPTSEEGATTAIAVALSVAALAPNLTVTPDHIDVPMVVGGQRTVELTVNNTGGAPAPAGTVQLSSAPWLGLASAAALPALGPGEQIQVVLLLSPAADLPLGVYDGGIVVDGLSVPYHVTAGSDQTGTLAITVEDEFSFYDEANGFPKVAGAVGQRRQRSHGRARRVGHQRCGRHDHAAALPIGTYNLAFTEAQHANLRSQVRVTAGQTTAFSAFMNRSLVTYQWTVLPTTVQDVYNISVQASSRRACPPLSSLSIPP